jgi:phosphoenolpyruvate carboxykinase (GTP)
MLPFCGYNMADYFSHWLATGAKSDAGKLPRIYYVNWFRKDGKGNYVWPGFGDNSRVLKWIVERLDGSAAATETAIGNVPAADALDVDGLDLTDEQVDLLLTVDNEAWRAEAEKIGQDYEKFGERLPQELRTQLSALKSRLDA